MPYLSFLLCCFVWGGSFILMDRAAYAFGPVAIAIGRMASGAVVIAAYCTLTRQWTRLTSRDWANLTIAALLANVWPYVVQPYAMRQAGEHAFFGMFTAFVPLATIVASIAMLRVHPTPRQLVGVLGGLVCMALVMWDGTHREMPLFVLALAVSTPVGYALGNTFIKWKLDHLPATPLTALLLAIGAVALVPLQLSPALLGGLRLSPPSAPHHYALALGSLILLGVMETGVCILIFVQMIKSRGPLFAGMVTYVIPLVAIAWGQLDGERLTAVQVAAIAGVLAMVALVQSSATPKSLAAIEPTGEPPA